MQKVFAAAAALVLAATPVSAGDVVVGQIGSYECGDNCYLTITSIEGTDLTALCVAEQCADWNMEAFMPEDRVGLSVVATVGLADQVDGSGTVMGQWLAFTTIQFLD